MKKSYKEIENVLENNVRPLLKKHGGNIELIDIKEKKVYVKFTGHCSGCPSAKYTMESIVKEEILKNTPWIDNVILHEEVSQELYDFAKEILNQSYAGRG